jgi:hypothetical protein
MLSSMARHLVVEWRNPSQWPRAAALAVAWPLGQYRGASLARRRRAPSAPGKSDTEADSVRPNRCPRLPHRARWSGLRRRTPRFTAGGDRVFILTREADRSRGEFALRREHCDGLEKAWINNTFASVRSFADTYTDDRIDRIAADLIDEFKPDVAHVHHLTCLSTTVVRELAVRNVPILHTLHDYWLLCHRGQLLDQTSALSEPASYGRARPGSVGVISGRDARSADCSAFRRFSRRCAQRDA